MLRAKRCTRAVTAQEFYVYPVKFFISKKIGNNMNEEPTPWSVKKEKLKEQYPSLTDEDLTHERGGVEQLIDNIQ